MSSAEVRALVAACLQADPERAALFRPVLNRCLTAPRLLSCRIADTSPSAPRYIPLWVVLEEPEGSDQRWFITFDADRVGFSLGFWASEVAWSQGGHAGFFEAVELLLSEIEVTVEV